MKLDEIMARDGIASSARTRRMLSQIRAEHPYARNDLEALLYAYRQGQKQDRQDINRLDSENDAEDAEIDDLQRQLDALKQRRSDEAITTALGFEGKDTWQKYKNPRAGGMSKKAVKSYRRANPGSKIQTAVTTKPSKLKKGSKSSKRRLSFCRRMRGMKKKRTSAKTARDPNSAINKSLRRWNCESIQDMRELVMIAEQRIQQLREARGEDDTSYRAAQYILKHEGDLSGASEDDILEAAVRALVNMGINPRTVRAIMDNPDFLSDVIEHVRALKESLRDGEYHIAHVTLDDGTVKRVRITTDEGFREQIRQYFERRGHEVRDIDVDFSVRMDEKKDACYNKVRSRYKVWPSAYASGALVQCRKKGADNWGTGGKK